MCVSLMHQDMRLLILYSHWLMDLMMLLYYQRKYMYMYMYHIQVHTVSVTYTYIVHIHIMLYVLPYIIRLTSFTLDMSHEISIMYTYTLLDLEGV